MDLIYSINFKKCSNRSFGKKQDIVEISEEAINEPKNLLLGHTVLIDKKGTCFFDNRKINPIALSIELDKIDVRKKKIASNLREDDIIWPFPRTSSLDKTVSSLVTGLFSNDKDKSTTKENKQTYTPSKINSLFLKQYTYDKIGGMDEIIKDIKEIIEFPIKYPEIYKHLKMNINRNLLLFGPPGCGKTMLAKTIANETGANLFMIKGPELQSHWYGETEERIRSVFKEAEKSEPAIIFIDEFDSLGTQRGNDGVASIKNDETNQLLTLIDELKNKNKNVFVIAATNFPQALDNAVIRKGRFDKHIKISIPDKNGVLEILKVKLKEKPFSNEINLENIANKCFSMQTSGSDIEAIVNDACMDLIKNQVKNKDFNKENVENIFLTKNNFDNALKKFENYKELMQKK